MNKTMNRVRRRILAATVLGLPAFSFQARASKSIEQPAKAGTAEFMERAFAQRQNAINAGDQGYGAIVVMDNQIVGQAPSRVVSNGDPTAHAEMEAIRDAAANLGKRNLSGCTMYSSSHPCPMCEAAAYWAGIDKMIWGRDATDAGPPGLC